MSSKSDQASLHRDAMFLLAGAARLVQRDFERRSKEYGMNRAQWQVLASLIRSQGERQVTLADKLDMAPIVLARIIDRLEESGYVERQADPSDRRAWRLYLTDTAEPLIAQMRLLANETGMLGFDGFSQEEIAMLVTLLGRLCGNLSDKFEVVGVVEDEGEK